SSLFYLIAKSHIRRDDLRIPENGWVTTEKNYIAPGPAPAGNCRIMFAFVIEDAAPDSTLFVDKIFDFESRAPTFTARK
ncbi:hypothetical protein NL376_27575, partial [Klebsiella pneumoniae]|nr:hypothetical protein [Klebsiella pneumoniae]